MQIGNAQTDELIQLSNQDWELKLQYHSIWTQANSIQPSIENVHAGIQFGATQHFEAHFCTGLQFKLDAGEKTE